MSKASKQGPTLRVFPNPYAHLDHNGLLAGICPQGEEVRDGATLPIRATIGSSYKVVDYDPGEPSPIPGGQPLRYSRTKIEWQHAAQPMAVPFSGALAEFYIQRLRCQEIFEVVSDGRVKVHQPTGAPVEMDLVDALAGARNRAIVGHFSAYLREPPTEKWAAQFGPDGDVAKVGKAALDEEIAKIRRRVKEAQEARAAKAAGKPVHVAESPKATPFPLRPAQPKTTTGKPAKE